MEDNGENPRELKWEYLKSKRKKREREKDRERGREREREREDGEWNNFPSTFLFSTYFLIK